MSNLIAPKIVYSDSLITIEFDLPTANTDIQGQEVFFSRNPIGKVTTVSSGKTSTIVNFVEEKITLKFSLIDVTLRNALQKMWDEWVVFGNPFFFFPDKTQGDFFPFILDEKKQTIYSKRSRR